MDDRLIHVNLDRAEACWVTALTRASEENLHSTSGCLGWTNEQLINHLVGGGLRYELLLTQTSPATVEATRGQNHLGGDHLASFWTHERALRRVAGECDLKLRVSHRIGPMSGHQLMRMRILELALHAADLSVGTGDEWPIDDQLAEFISTELGELIVKLGASGGYAPPRPTTDAQNSHATRVLRLAGR